MLKVVKVASAQDIAGGEKKIQTSGLQSRAATNRYKKPPSAGELGLQLKKSAKLDSQNLNILEILSRFKGKRSLSKSKHGSSISFELKQAKGKEASDCDLRQKKKKPKKSIARHKSTHSEADISRYALKVKSSKAFTFAIRTKKGVGSGKKVNQDSFVSAMNFRGSMDEHLFGIFDGHGTNGHLVSNFISSNISGVLAAKLLQNQSPEIALHNTHKSLNDLLLGSSIDVTFSGSTAVTCFLQDDTIYCANAGDSRAIIGYETPSGNFAFKKLSQDHKLTLEDEKKRIEKSGGVVQPFTAEDGEECGPPRVWLPGKNFPGLAMSRCIGDLVAASVGVQWQPGIYIK